MPASIRCEPEEWMAALRARSASEWLEGVEDSAKVADGGSPGISWSCESRCRPRKVPPARQVAVRLGSIAYAVPPGKRDDREHQDSLREDDTCSSRKPATTRTPGCGRAQAVKKAFGPPQAVSSVVSRGFPGARAGCPRGGDSRNHGPGGTVPRASRARTARPRISRISLRRAPAPCSLPGECGMRITECGRRRHRASVLRSPLSGIQSRSRCARPSRPCDATGNGGAG
jgi:hypothetical protein